MSGDRDDPEDDGWKFAALVACACGVGIVLILVVSVVARHL